MGNVLGGFKNMLRRWRINLKQKKKKEQNWKVKSFFYSLIAIIYWPIGSLLSNHTIKKEKKITQKHPEITENIKQIDNSLSKQMKENVIDVTNKQKIDKIENQVFELKKYEKKYFDKKIEILKTKNEYIEKRNNTTKEPLIQAAQLKSIEVLQKSNQQEQLKTQEVSNDNIKNINDVVNKNLEKIKKIEEKIEKIEDYNILQFYENELKYIYKEIEQIKNIEIKKYKIDFNKYKLLTNESLSGVLKKIDSDIGKIKINKEKIYFETSEKGINKDAKKEHKKEMKQDKIDTKKVAKKITEMERASQIIIYNVINQEKYFQEYCQSFYKTNNRKQLIFNSSNIILNTILSFRIYILPFNRTLNLLIGNIMINNYLRNIRRMVNPNLAIQFQYLKEKYHEAQNILQESYQICCDSLEQLDMIEWELRYLDKDNEIYMKIESLRHILNEQKNKIIKQNVTFEKTYTKTLRHIA